MSNSIRNLFLLLALAGLAACSSDSSGTAAAGIQEGSGASVLGAASGSLNSADLIDVQAASLGSRMQSTNDSLCSSNGEPWDTNTNAVMLDSNSAYPGRLFYCLVSSGAIESSDTLPGQLRQLQSILCTMEEGVSLTPSSYTDSGAELITSSPQSVSFSSTCWPQGAPDGLTQLPIDSVVATSLDSATTGYQYQIRVVSSAAQVDVTLRFFNNNGIFGFQKMEAGATGFSGSDFRMTVDTNTGTLLANIIEDRGGAGGADSVYRTLVRLRVKGTMNTSTFQFSAVTEGKGIYFISGPALDDVAAGNDTSFAYNAYTASGNSTTGYQFTRWQTNDSATTTPSNVRQACEGGTQTCADAFDFSTVAGSMNGFMAKNAAGKSGWDAYITSGLPMCEASTGAAAIDLSDVPTSTGALGVCN